MKEKTEETKKADLIDLGKKLEAFYESGYVNKKQALSWAFLKGIAGGFGAVVGGTIVVGLVLWILSFFTQFPFVHSIDHALQSGVHK